PDMALVPCFAPDDASCTIFPSCALRGVLAEARDAFLAVLDKHTLADLVRPRMPLQKLLSTPPPNRMAARSARPAKRAQS
ncbi:MAG: Rrf2 family transcriptional regulator, partial [Rhizobiales bacterium]|nr:Rrf2 family transcriptional regulator [Hyphomicrobiales bacterium]